MRYLSAEYDIILLSQPDPISNIGILLRPKFRGTEYFVDVRDDWPRTLSFLEVSRLFYLFTFSS